MTFLQTEPMTQIEKDSPKLSPVELPKKELPKKPTSTPSGKSGKMRVVGLAGVWFNRNAAFIEPEVADEYPEFITPVR